MALVREITRSHVLGQRLTIVATLLQRLRRLPLSIQLAPEFTSIPADYTAECSVTTHPMDDASATDNCGEVTIAVVETTIPGACAGDYTFTRAFTATDDCGNATSATQTITIIDTTSPVFTSVPSDYTASCEDVLAFDDASATDNCGVVIITSCRRNCDWKCSWIIYYHSHLHCD